MGVKKLLKYLNENQSALSELVEIKESRRGATAQTKPRVILADGSGFLMELHKEALKRAGELPDNVLYADSDILGGDLQPFRSALTHVAKRLKAAYNVRLVIAMDAPQGLVPNPAREAKWQERADERIRRDAALNSYCTDATVSRDTDRERPPMITTQTIVALESLGVQIIQLDDEVDVHIGALVQKLKPICVITNDTDLVVTSPDIPTTLLQVDFPWIALLSGWDPRRHDGDAANSGPPKALVFRLFPTSRLMGFLKISIRQLWIVASLMGNDITGAVTRVDANGIQWSFVTRTNANGRPYVESIAQAARRAIDAATQGTGAYGLDAAATEAVETSVKRYERSASPTQHFSLDEDELPVYDAMVVAQKLPAFYFIGRRDAKFTIDAGNMPRLKEILVVVAHVLGLKTVSFAERDTPDVVSTIAVSLRPEVEQCIRPMWSPEARTDPRPFAEKLAALALMFNLDPALFTSTESLLPASVWLTLWVLQPLCDATTYRHIAEMMVLVWLSEAQGVGSPAHRIIVSLARWQNSRTRHPSVAAQKVGKQFAIAHIEVHSLLNLLSLDDALELPLPAPASLFSGSVLHYLFSFGGPLDNAALDILGLDDATLADVPRILTAIEVLASQRLGV